MPDGKKGIKITHVPFISHAWHTHRRYACVKLPLHGIAHACDAERLVCAVCG